MTAESMRVLLWGALILGCLCVSVFFVRFWALSRDRFFIFLATAFGCLALNWAALAAIPIEDETRHYAYFARLLAFVLIIIGIADKNRRS
jgi:hypothetical protein